MLQPGDYLDPFLAFREAQQAFRRGALTAQGLKAPAEALQQCLHRLEQRLNWELPLLAGFSEASQAIESTRKPLEELQRLLPLEPHSDRVEVQLLKTLSGLRRIQLFVDHLPCFTDIGVVNDLLVLGGAENPDRQALALRLPLFLQWLRELETSWELFGHGSLKARAQTILRALQGAAGGIYLYLQGEEPQALQPSLRLMVEALEALGPVEETRYLDELQQAQWSPELVLERAFRLLDESGQVPPHYHPVLNRWINEQSRRLQDLRCLGRLRPQLPTAALVELEESLRQWSGAAFDRQQLQRLEQWRLRKAQWEEAHAPIT